MLFTSFPIRLPALVGRVLVVAVAAAVLAPSAVLARSPLPGDVPALGRQRAVAATDQVVVTWSRASLGATGAKRLAALQQVSRTRRVSAAAGSEARFVRPFGNDGTKAVYRLSKPLGTRAGRTIDQIARLPGVVAVEPDARVTIDTIPSDTYGSYLWGALGPGDTSVYGAATYGINAVGVWGATRGSGIRVAVLDTGITAHADLAGQAAAGYDFITDPWIANDGGGRDGNPSDPGDWVSSDDELVHPECSVAPSSWHGTHVAGTIAALASNGLATFGAAPGATLVPVRVLGKCGGYDTDIADAITWASGGSVSGVAAIGTPAKVISMSLGGASSCASYMQTAINGARSRGSVVVVAAGNSGVDASLSSPANCAGSLVVAATDIAGKKASFSNFGSIVDVAAPGVDVVSTWNSGKTGPDADAVAAMRGTSMATPHVSALAALLFEDHPAALPSAIEYAITHGVTAFPADGAPNACTAGAKCGLGIANAPAALATLDTTAPTATVSPPGPWTNVASPVFSVGFGEAVTGLGAGDLTIAGTATGCSVGTPAGSGTSWTVALNGCSEGTVAPTLTAGSVADASGNPGPAAPVTSDAAIIDRTAPLSSGSIAATTTGGTSIGVGFTASDAGSGLASVTAYYSTAAGLTSPQACGTIVGAATSGTITCTIPAIDATYRVYTRATDAAGNTEAAPGDADDTIVRDTTTPAVASFVVREASDTGRRTDDHLTSAASLVYDLTFLEPVTGLAPDDLANAGDASGCGFTVSGSGNAWTVTAGGCSAGIVTPSLRAGAVSDGVTTGPAVSTTGTTMEIDRTAPTLAITSVPASGAVSSSPDVTITVNGSEALDCGTISTGADGDVAGTGLASLGAATGSGTTECTIPATALAGDDDEVDVTVGLGAAFAISDDAGNAATTASGLPVTFRVDRRAPGVTAGAPDAAITVDQPAYSITFSEPVSGLAARDLTLDPDGTATGCAIGGPVDSGDATTFAVALSGCSDGTVHLVLAADAVVDVAGNAGPEVPHVFAVVTRGDAGPAVLDAAPVAAVTNAQPVFEITFSSPVTGFTAADLVVDPVGCSVGEPVDTGTGASWTIALAGCPDGVVGLVLAAHAVDGQGGSPGPAADVPLGTVTVDTVAPRASAPSVGLRAGARLSGTAAPVTVSWPAATDAGGTGIAAYKVSKSTDGGTTWTPVATTGGRTLATWAPTSGTIRYRVVAVDAAGNGSAATEGIGAVRSLVLVQQTKATYAKTWTTRSSSSYSGGSAKYAKAAGATATWTFTGRQVAFVTTTAASRGKVRITVGGTSWTRDLKAATAYRHVPWTGSWSTGATRTIRITVLGTSGRPRVDVDAIVVLK